MTNEQTTATATATATQMQQVRAQQGEGSAVERGGSKELAMQSDAITCQSAHTHLHSECHARARAGAEQHRQHISSAAAALVKAATAQLDSRWRCR